MAKLLTLALDVNNGFSDLGVRCLVNLKFPGKYYTYQVSLHVVGKRFLNLV